jgi:hypothetical protein
MWPCRGHPPNDKGARFVTVQSARVKSRKSEAFIVEKVYQPPAAGCARIAPSLGSVGLDHFSTSHQRFEVLVSANFAMLLRRCRIRYNDPTFSVVPCSIHLSHCIHAKSTIPCPHQQSHQALSRASRTPAQHPWSSYHHCKIVSLSVFSIHNPRFLKGNIPKFEMLASLQRQLCLRLAGCALQS